MDKIYQQDKITELGIRIAQVFNSAPTDMVQNVMMKLFTEVVRAHLDCPLWVTYSRPDSTED